LGLNDEPDGTRGGAGRGEESHKLREEALAGDQKRAQLGCGEFCPMRISDKK